MKKVTRKYVNHTDTDCVAPSTLSASTRNTKNFTSSTFHPTSGSKRAWADRIREKLPSLGEHEYEVLWERGVLGVIFLESEKDGIPYVSKATESCISDAVSPGDILKYVNIVCSKDHSFSEFFKILATMKKPVLLRFERVHYNDYDKRRKRNSVRSRSSTNLSSARHEPEAVEDKKKDLVESIKSIRSNSLPPKDAIIHPKSIRSSFWRSNKNSGKTEGAGTIASKTPHSGSVVATCHLEDQNFDTLSVEKMQESGELKPSRISRSISISTITEKDTPREKIADAEYEVVWVTGSLGLFFGEHRLSHLPMVTRSSASLDPAIKAKVEMGDLLLKANDLDAHGYSFEDFFARLQKVSKPVHLTFRRGSVEENRSRHSASPKMIARMLNDLENVRDTMKDPESTEAAHELSSLITKKMQVCEVEKASDEAADHLSENIKDQVSENDTSSSDNIHRYSSPESDDESISDDEESISRDDMLESIEECLPDNTDESGSELCEEIEDDKNTSDTVYESDQVLHSALTADTVDTIPPDIMEDQDPDVTRDDLVESVIPINSTDSASQSKYLTKSPFANMANLNATVARYRRRSKHSREVNKLPAITETIAHTVPLVAPHAVNTSVQVRGRARSKTTFSDTPDSATYLVKWKENYSIGFQVREARLTKGTFPLIVGVCRNTCCEALRHVCIGDIILEINGKDTSSMGVKKTASFIRTCSKTALIKLRHGPGFVSERVSAYV